MMKLKVMMMTLMMCLITMVSFGQELNYKDLSTITFKIGQSYTSYVASDNAIYKIGDNIILNVPSSNKTFAFITKGDGILLPITTLSTSSSGEKTEIKKIFIQGNKRIGYRVWFKTKGYAFGYNYNIDFENALTTGEIKGFGITSDNALLELKKAKDKLDLGLITQEEFDNLKKELSKYIK